VRGVVLAVVLGLLATAMAVGVDLRGECEGRIDDPLVSVVVSYVPG